MDIVVPALGESVTEATVAEWLKQVGDAVALDEPLVSLETDKVTLEVPSPMAGVLSEVLAAPGANVEVGALLARISEGSGNQAAPAAAPPPTPVAASAPPAPAGPAVLQASGPAVQRVVSENKLDAAQIPATGKDGRLTKGDVLGFMQSGGAPRMMETKAVAERPANDREQRVRMTKLRRVIAQRLKDAQNTAAMLTTFNEVDMTAVMALRQTYRDRFEKRHGGRLGFMSFFVKAAVQALKDIPAVNAEIYGEDAIYKNYYDIGIAVGGAQGLVVPVLRDAEHLSLVDIEKNIADFGRRAREGKLTVAEMTGGTFTITNGGVFGSLLSTPILNPPQSGILGMHKTQERPMVVGGEIVIRPMMYLALSYDHRIVDGREAVSFLVRIKEMVEDPQRLLLQV